MMHEVTGDLVTFDKADVLAHQCNTVTSRGCSMANGENDTYISVYNGHSK